MPFQKNTAKDVTRTEKAALALELRKAGCTFEEIAARAGYADKSNAYRAVRNALRKMLQEPADEVRQLELARLDRMMLAVWSKATAGDLGAVDRVLKLLERRARLLGLDLQPEQSEVNVAVQINYGTDPARMIEGEVIEDAVPELPAPKNGRKNGRRNGDDV